MQSQAVSRLTGALILSAFVVLALSAAARAELRTFPVPKVTVYPGDTVTRDLLELRSLTVAAGVEYPVFSNPDLLLGKVARRTLLPGKAIPLNFVRNPYLVVQGQSSRILFELNGLTISSYATALQSGEQDEIITLRNNDTGIVIKGVVQWDGTIRVGER